MPLIPARSASREAANFMPSMDEKVYEQLFSAVRRRDINAVRTLVHAYPSINLNCHMPTFYPDDEEMVEYPTPLQYALCCDAKAMRDALLELGADPSAASGSPYPLKPVHVAAYADSADSLMALVRAGADIHAPDSRGRHALAHCSGYAWEAIRLLLVLGADPDSGREDGFTCLHSACVPRDLPNGRTMMEEETVRLLLEAGADPLYVSKRGTTPLHHAKTNHPESARHLMVERYANMPRFDAQSPATLEEILAPDANGYRMVDNPWNWRHGMAEHWVALAHAGAQTMPDKKALLASSNSSGTSIAEIMIQAHQTSAFLKILHERGEELRAADLIQRYEPTSLLRTLQESGQLITLLREPHVSQQALDVVRIAADFLLPEQQSLIGRRQVLLNLSRQQATADRGRV